MAVEEANASGGFEGAPYRLIPAWSQNPWEAAVRQLADIVFQRRVWVIVGGADSATTHLAEQIVAKAHVPLVSPISTDKTVNLANVPWTFSMATGRPSARAAPGAGSGLPDQDRNGSSG